MLTSCSLIVNAFNYLILAITCKLLTYNIQGYYLLVIKGVNYCDVCRSIFISLDKVSCPLKLLFTPFIIEE